MASTKGFLVVLGIIFYMVNIRTVESEVPEDEVEKKCKEEYKVDENIFIKDGKPGDDVDNFDIILKDESNEDHRCFIQCIMDGFGYLKEGELDQDFVLAEVRKELDEEGVDVEEKQIKMDIASCAKKTGEGKCNKTYQILKCLSNLSNKKSRSSECQ